jgi:UDP-glucose 4-epimerase
MLDVFSLNKTLENSDVVFHLGANPAVRLGANDTTSAYEQNLLANYALLEVIRKKLQHPRK